MATLRDIADHLGLSVSTVSRVLSGKGRVGEETIERVLEYTRKIDYHPNQLAQRLKLQTTGSVGVVVPDISNEFYATLFKEIDRRLAPTGLTPILFNIGDTLSRESTFLGHIRSAVVDGMIVATAGADVYASLSDDVMRRLVFVDNRPLGVHSYVYVGADNVDSSARLTRHIIDRGHSRIATIMGPSEESSAAERTEGFHSVMRELGLELPDEWCVQARFDYADGRAKALALLNAPIRPTAIIAQNNVLAYATIRSVRECGLRVPDDVAVACFDHIDTYQFMRPRITTMLQPLDEIAELACDRLVSAINGETPKHTTTVKAAFKAGDTT